jgi:hemoglobin
VIQKSAQTLYDQIGKDRLAELVKVFYDIVETDPTDGAVIHKLHTGHPIKHTRVAQLEFLTGFLGGPKYYRERTGHFDLRYIHERVEIGHQAKDAWLVCMDRAIDRVGFEPELKRRLMDILTRAAEISRNQD